MISKTLEKARKYEEVFGEKIEEKERPAFHLSARVGWMNDPNGFSFYKGKYHIFYQYHPYESKWGAMHWGHAVSEDLLHWEYLPAALAPDEDYDRDGCFSGSALTLSDGRQMLMYTGVVKKDLEDGSTCEVQTQCLAVGDGLNYEKYENNPVLCCDDLPEGSSELDFRDPKIWQREDGGYYCVVGNRPADGSGQILLFDSDDGFQWSFKTVLCANDNRFGKMWECPDFFELDGKWVLIVSPQDMLPEGFEYHNGNGTLCLIGEFDEESTVFQEQYEHAIDYGIDFYAPQTILTEDNRRIMIGWMQNWDTCSMRLPIEPWFGQMSLPRELSVRNGRLYQKPIRELEALRYNKSEHLNIVFSGSLSLGEIQGRMVDMEITLSSEKESSPYKKFALYFAQNETYRTSLSFHPEDCILKIDRKFSGSRRAMIHQRRSMVNSENGKLKLRVILDRFSVEVFVNDGEQVLSATLYTDQAADGISFFAVGNVKMNLVKYDLKL